MLVGAVTCTHRHPLAVFLTIRRAGQPLSNPLALCVPTSLVPSCAWCYGLLYVFYLLRHYWWWSPLRPRALGPHTATPLVCRAPCTRPLGNYAGQLLMSPCTLCFYRLAAWPEERGRAFCVHGDIIIRGSFCVITAPMHWHAEAFLLCLLALASSCAAALLLSTASAAL